MDVENSIAPVRSKSGHDSPLERNGLNGVKSGPVRFGTSPVLSAHFILAHTVYTCIRDYYG